MSAGDDPTTNPARIINGSLTRSYQDGYARRMEGGPNATLYAPDDPQGRWLYMNGVLDAVVDLSQTSHAQRRRGR